MNCWFKFGFLFTLLLLKGALSQEADERRAPKCKNPKGKVWESILNGDCGQSVCKKVGKNLARWEKCPRPATEEMVDKLNKTMSMDNKAIMAAFLMLGELLKTEMKRVEEKVEAVCGVPTTVWPTTEDQTVGPTVDAVITRLPIIGGSCGNCWHVQDGKVDAIDFVSSKDIEIRGISLFRSYTGTKTFTGLIQLKEGSSVIASQMFDFTTDDAQTYFDQLFNTPSNVRAGVKYTITLEYNGPRTRIWYGTDGQTSPSTTCGGDSVAFQFSGSAETNNGNNVRHGQIPRVLISC